MNAENRRADSFHVTISNELLSLRIIIVSRTRARTVGRKFGITNALCKCDRLKIESSRGASSVTF